MPFEGLAPSVNPYALPALDAQYMRTIAPNTVVGGIHTLRYFEIAAAAAADYNIVVTYKTVITRVQVHLIGAGVVGSTVTVQNAADPISEALDTSGILGTLVHGGWIDPAHNTIAAGGTLRVSAAGAGGCPSMRVYVLGFRAV
jgi:hypothetical protein